MKVSITGMAKGTDGEPVFFEISFMAFTILAISDLGTVASSRMVVGFKRARADKAARLAVLKASASCSDFASCTDTAPCF